MKVFFLIKTETGKMEEVCERLEKLKEITSTCMTYGRWDVVAEGEFKNLDAINRFLEKDIIKVTGINRSNTLIEAQ